MTPQRQVSGLAKQLLASKGCFERSTSVLEEADSAFRPREETMTAAQQVAHTAITIDWFIEGVSRPEGFDLDFEKHARTVSAVTSLAEARRMLERAYDNAIGFIGRLTPEEGARRLAGPVMEGEPVSGVVWGIVEHTAHHRGALTVYSRLLGKVPPMPYGG